MDHLEQGGAGTVAVHQVAIVGELDAADLLCQQLAASLLQLVNAVSRICPDIEPGQHRLENVHQVQKARAV